MKNILIISSSPRKKGNSQILCEQFKKGAEAKGHQVKIVRIMEQNIGFCRACDGCMRNGGTCVLKDDMAEILKMFQKADVLVLATPVYFYGISAQMKTFIDRTYPIWQHLGKKEVYYIISAGLGEDIIERSLGDLNGFVEHLEEYRIAGKIYAAKTLDKVFQIMREWGNRYCGNYCQPQRNFRICRHLFTLITDAILSLGNSVLLILILHV